MPNVFFSADLHIGHKNIIEYSNRPFDSIEEHDEFLIKWWNDDVRPGDSVYCLGDFALCDPERAIKMAKRLAGQKYFVWGNHDKALRKDKAFESLWIWTKDLAEITVQEQKIILCHYAMKTWNQSHRGSWNLHGHSHGSLPDDPNSLQLDVGVDSWAMRPVRFETLKNRMSQKAYKPIDHHGQRDFEKKGEPER